MRRGGEARREKIVQKRKLFGKISNNSIDNGSGCSHDGWFCGHGRSFRIPESKTANAKAGNG